MTSVAKTNTQMHGMEGAMLKKKFLARDLHMNSNIMIHMDEKPRHKSHYMKKFDRNLQKPKQRI